MATISYQDRKRAYAGFLEWLADNEVRTGERVGYKNTLAYFHAFFPESASGEERVEIRSQTPLEKTRLPWKAVNALKQEGLEYVEDLSKKTEKEVQNYSGIGKRYMGRIKRSLVKRGLSFRDQ